MATVERLPRAPFRGLEPLRCVDRPIFSGRERETEMLRRLIVIYRAVLLYGDSGTGKSSLLNAGLIPDVLAEGLRPERVRVQPRRGEEIVVERIALSDDEPPTYLASGLVPDDHPSAVFSLTAFREQLGAAGDGSAPLLIFDQFEELVTLFQETPSDTKLSERRDLQRSIVGLLDELLSDRTIAVKVLFAFREDYFAKVLDLLAAHTHIKDQYVRLTPPSEDDLRAIVRGPFERLPGVFERELSGELCDRLVAAIVARSDSRSSRLSELQVACLRLWQADDPDELFERRGLQGLLEDELSAAIDRLDPTIRYAAIALLAQMVTASGARNVISEEDLISRASVEAAIPAETLRTALAALENDTRLVRREVRHNVTFFEIVSEFLLPWIARHRQRAEISRVKADVAPERLEDALRWHELMAQRMSLRYRVLQIAQFAAFAAVPLLAAADVAGAVIAAVALLALLLGTAQQFLRLQDRWISYRKDAEALNREKHLFIARGGPYADAYEPERLLSERVEALLAKGSLAEQANVDRPIFLPDPPPVVAEQPAWQRAADSVRFYAIRGRRARSLATGVTAAQVVVLAAVAVAAVAGTTAVVIGALGVGVLVMEGLQQLLQLRETASLYRRTAEQLSHEMTLYLSRAGGYGGGWEWADVLFAERVEALLAQETPMWVDVRQPARQASAGDSYE